MNNIYPSLLVTQATLTIYRNYKYAMSEASVTLPKRKRKYGNQ